MGNKRLRYILFPTRRILINIAAILFLIFSLLFSSCKVQKFDPAVTDPATGAQTTDGITLANIISVSSTSGTYYENDDVFIEITFSEQVEVSTTNGTPYINLDLDTGDTASALYVSGNQSSVIFFQYEVKADQSTSDLQYVAGSSIILNGGSINPSNSDELDLSLPTIGDGDSLAENADVVIDVIPEVVNVLPMTPDGSYNTGDIIAIQIVFSESVVVTGTPELSLNELGGAKAYYISGSGSNSLTFYYTIAAGEDSLSLDYNDINSLDLAGGSIKQRDGESKNAVLTLPTPGASGSLAANSDLHAHSTPQITNVTSITASGTYLADDIIQIQVDFSENVDVDTLGGTASPLLVLNAGQTASAYYTSGSGTTSLIFKYIVGAADEALAPTGLDYTSINSLSLNGGTIKDSSDPNNEDADLTLPTPGEESSLSYNSDIYIDTLPTLTNVKAQSDGTYDTGQTVVIEVEFSDPAVVDTTGGTPKLLLNSASTATAFYSSGSGTTTLYFNYVVGDFDDSDDLDYIDTSSLKTNGGTIRDIQGNDISLTLSTPGSAGSISNNNNVIILTRPQVTEVTSNPSTGTYDAGDVISIYIKFSEIVNVDAGGGTASPLLALNSSSTANASYLSGSGTDTLLFKYYVSAIDNSLDLDYSSINALTLNGGSIVDTFTNPRSATLTLPGPTSNDSLAVNSNVIIDNPPQITNVTSNNADGTYGLNEEIFIDIVFSELVDVDTSSGVPFIQHDTTQSASAYYVSGSGTSTLSFYYKVAPRQNIADLSYESVSSLILNGSTIRDRDGNFDDLVTNPLPSPGGAGSLSDNKDIVIDTKALIYNVYSSNSDGTYVPGQTVDIKIDFTEPVNVVTAGGVPYLTLVFDNLTTSNAPYNSGTGSSTLTFRYTVESDDKTSDLNYQDIDSLQLNGGEIVDVEEGEAAILTLPGNLNPYGYGSPNSLEGNSDIEIISPPAVTNVYSTNLDGTYLIDQEIYINVVFAEPVLVVGIPTLTLETGPIDQIINYSSGSGTDELTFYYKVQDNDYSTDLDYTASTSLTLNGGLIRDDEGNDATLTLPNPGAAGSLGNNNNISIFTDPVPINVYSDTSNAPRYDVGDGPIYIKVTFSEDVNVTGSPLITLNVGSTATAFYDSQSASDTLQFKYEIAAGENSADLEYVDVFSLQFNGGTIEDLSSNSALLILPEIGGGYSLSDNEDLIVDTFPIVTNVTSSNQDRIHYYDETISIQMEFSEVINITGVPYLDLGLDYGTATAAYTLGAGTNTLTFEYQIKNGTVVADLDYNGTDAVKFNGGSIRDIDFDTDLFDNSAGSLPTPGAIGSLGYNKNIAIETSTVISDISSSSGPGPLDYGDPLSIQVSFTEPVTVVGTPMLTLNIASDATAYYNGTNNTASGYSVLTFDYDIKTTDNTPQGTYLNYAGTSSFVLPSGGSIKNGDDEDVTVTIDSNCAACAITYDQSIAIDTVPSVVNVDASPTLDASHGPGAVIPIEITFSEEVDVTGTPYLDMDVGNSASASYYSGSGSNTLTFVYTVGSTDYSADLDYSATSSLTLNGGTIKDSDDVGFGFRDANLTLPIPGEANSLSANRNIVLDTVPAVVNVSSTTPDSTLGLAAVIPIQVTFSEPVDVTGVPILEMDVGTTATAKFIMGNGTDVLTFEYIVKEGENSPDLDYTATNSLTLNGGTMLDSDLNAAVLTLPTPGASGSLSNNKDLVINTNPIITNVTTTSGDGPHDINDTVLIDLTISEIVTVDTVGGTSTPYVDLDLQNGTASASYVSGSGTDTLRFSYTVGAGEDSQDLDLSALQLNGGTIEDASSNAIVTSSLPTGTDSGSLKNNHDVVISTTPQITNVTSTIPGDGTYSTVGTDIFIDVTFTEAVSIVATPSLGLAMNGGTTATANYDSGDGSDTYTFKYTIVIGDNSPALPTGLDYNTNGLVGSLEDPWGKSADLTTLPAPAASNSLGDNTDIVIDTVPTIVDVSSVTGTGTYNINQSISFQVEFTESVYVTATPTLSLNSTGEASYSGAGSGTNILNFSYTVGAGEDSDDLDVTSVNLPGGAAIVDTATNSADLSSLPINPQAGSLMVNHDIVIETIPTVTNITSSKVDGTYSTGENIIVDVVFSEVVEITGSPYLTLNPTIRGRNHTASASYSAGSGTDTLSFSYDVVSGENSGDLNYTASNSLSLNGGTVTDNFSSNPRIADLTLPEPATASSLGTNKNIIIDTPPIISNVSSTTATGTYNLGANINVQVAFSENISVAGTPVNLAITLNSGNVVSTASATYSAVTSGTNTLDFSYTVGAGEESSDLDYLSSTSLIINSGTIKDEDGTADDAILTLPTPGNQYSLGYNEDLVIDTDCMVIKVDTSTYSGVYGIGENIPIDVYFSELVNVTNYPYLVLKTSDSAGGVNRRAYYTSGTGSTILTFNYVVGEGDHNSDLDYATTTSLIKPSGAQIRDINSAVVDLTLPAIGGGYSLGDLKDINIASKAIAAGMYHSCALNYGIVQCWGDNVNGQLGNNSTSPSSSVPVNVTTMGAGKNIIQIAANDNHTCSVLNGEVWCWGDNEFGQLGDGNLPIDSNVPVQAISANAVQVVTGVGFSCALLSSQEVQCWGINNVGQLGNNDIPNASSVPVNVLRQTGPDVNLSGVYQIYAGNYHACALLDNDTIKCWGYNQYGQLGEGTTSNSSIATDVTVLSDNVKQLSLGDNFTCALTVSETIKCWGSDIAGRLGDSTSQTNSLTPVDVEDLTSGVTYIASGEGHSCAVYNTGTEDGIKCWGENNNGQLGDNSTSSQETPVAVTNLGTGSDSTFVTAGRWHTCSIANEQMKCWGRSQEKQLGIIGDTYTNTKIPLGVYNLGALELASHYSHGCFLENNVVKCWGENSSSQLGDNTVVDQYQPVYVLDPIYYAETPPLSYLGGVTQITTGYGFSCFIRYGGVACLGLNSKGQLGDGNTPVTQTYLTEVSSIGSLGSGVVSIATGYDHACAITHTASDSVVNCWGNNDYGQLGNNNPFVSSDTPVTATPSMTSASQIAAGLAHTCALESEGTVKCWGDNFYGQIGNQDSPNDTAIATSASALLDASFIAVGNNHTCAIVNYGNDIKCWGRNNSGQLGIDKVVYQTRDIPTDITRVGNLVDATQLAAGDHHTCAIVSGGKIICWGDNSMGQLGNNSTVESYVPVTVLDDTGLSELTGAVRISAGDRYTCAAFDSGTGEEVKCWGLNDFGELGVDPASTTNSLLPVDVGF